MKKILLVIMPILFCALLAALFVYPVFNGLILLPLDLLVSNYSPWNFASTILLKNAFMQDSILQLFPWRHLTFESLSSGIIPFWNPYQFMGMPFMASMKPMVWYPLNIFFPLGEMASWHALLLFQLFGSLIFMYMFACDLGIKKLPAVLSAISFAFSSLMVGVLEFGSEGNVLLWLPFFLYVIKRYLDSRQGIFLFAFGFSVACAVFAGHLQYLAYELLMVGLFAYTYGRSLRVEIKTYVWLATALLLGLGIAAIQLVPSIEMFRYSYRGLSSSFDVFSSGLLKPYQFIRLLAPDFFGHPLTRDLHMGYIEQSGYFGLIPLFFALYAMVYERKNILVKLFSIIFCAGALFSLDGIGQMLYWLKIPIITSGYGGRIFFAVLTSGAVLAGYGLSSFIASGREKEKKWSISVYIVVVALLIGVSLALGRYLHTPFPVLANVKFPFIILSLFTVVSVFYYLTKKYSSSVVTVLFVIALIGITYFDLFRLGYRFLTFSNDKFLYPSSEITNFIKSQSSNSLGRVYGLAEPEIPTYMGIYSAETYNPLYPLRSAVLLNSLMKLPSEEFPTNKYNLSRSPNLKRTLDFLGVSYLVATKDKYLSTEFFYTGEYHGDFTRVFGDDRIDVYKSRSAHPRFGLFYKAKHGISDKEILQILHEGSIDTSNTVLLESTLPVELKEGSGSATLIHTDLNTQQYAIETNSAAIFYISDTYYPGWTAQVNGKDQRIYRANYNFKAVLVPAGASTLTFSYIPTWWSQSVAVSAISLCLLCAFSLKKPRKTAQNANRK